MCKTCSDNTDYNDLFSWSGLRDGVASLWGVVSDEGPPYLVPVATCRTSKPTIQLMSILILWCSDLTGLLFLLC